MAKRENVIPKGMENIHERFHYSPAVKAGGLLFVAGRVGRNEDLEVIENTEAQFVQAFENVKKVLAAAGATFDDVVEMVTYQTDMRDLPLLMKVQRSLLHPGLSGVDGDRRNFARDARTQTGNQMHRDARGLNRHARNSSLSHAKGRANVTTLRARVERLEHCGGRERRTLADLVRAAQNGEAAQRMRQGSPAAFGQ